MLIRRLAVSLLLIGPLFVVGCGGGNPVVSTPTAPTTPTSTIPPVAETPFSLQGVASTPDGTGVQYNTNFQFTASGSFPSGTQFVWNFGDGSSTTTSSPTAGRVFGQAGVFSVSVEARSGANTGAVSKVVSVRSMLGRWLGTISGFTHFPLQRPVPMTSFELLVANQTLDGSSVMLAGRWADDAGCRETRDQFLRQRLQPAASATVTFGINALSCADGDFYMTGLADPKFDRVEGSCDVAGGNPNCRFSMTRQ